MGTHAARKFSGVYASAPSGWVDGMPHAAWIQAKIKAAKKLHHFCLQSRTLLICPRHGTPMPALDNSSNSAHGCERCADELTWMLHGWDLEFDRCRVLEPPLGAVTSFGTYAATSIACAYRECGRRFVARNPSHRYCCAKCYQAAKQARVVAARRKRHA